MSSLKSFDSIEPHRKLTAALGCLYSAYIALDSQTIYHYLKAKPYRYIRFLSPIGFICSIASYFDHKYNFLTAGTFLLHLSVCSPRFVYCNRLRSFAVVVMRLYYERINCKKPHEHFSSIYDFKPRYYLP